MSLEIKYKDAYPKAQTIIDRYVSIESILDVFGILSIIDISRYPHKCNKCGNPAYIGAYDVDCSNKDCR